MALFLRISRLPAHNIVSRKIFGSSRPRAKPITVERIERQKYRRSASSKTGFHRPRGLTDNTRKQEMSRANDVDDVTPNLKHQTHSDSTRLGGPAAFDDPQYSGVVLPFEDKSKQINPEQQSASAVGEQPNTSGSIGIENPIGSTFDTRVTEPKDSLGTRSAFRSDFKLKKIFADEDPFLIVHGTAQAAPTVFEFVEHLREYRQKVAQRGQSVGFVPTMGALHQGHLDLMKAAAAQCDEVWVSIYVNPTQFGANEDLSTYPSTWEADLAKIESLNEELLFKGLGRVSAIFKPATPEVLYPYGVEGTSHVIINPELTQILEGSSRPTFFRGVTTVVMKLLNIVQPNRVYFGQKDIQQFAVIKRMIKEFHLPVQIERVPTTREYSGLAMSSRNAYLGRRRLKAAEVLHNMISAAKATFDATPADQRTRKLLLDSAMKVYRAEKDHHAEKEMSNPGHAVQFKLDYLSLADPDTLREIPDRVGRQGAIMSLAVYFQPLIKETIWKGEELGINQDSTIVRLIDNELLGVDQDSEDQHGRATSGGLGM